MDTPGRDHAEAALPSSQNPEPLPAAKQSSFTPQVDQLAISMSVCADGGGGWASHAASSCDNVSAGVAVGANQTLRSGCCAASSFDNVSAGVAVGADQTPKPGCLVDAWCRATAAGVPDWRHAPAQAGRPVCHVHSLPDVLHCARRPVMTGCDTPAVAQDATAAAAATGSPPTDLQSSTSRLSVTLAVRRAQRCTASPLSSVSLFCRICHEGESREQLISPCRCAGSVGLVHVSCIEKWLSSANKDSCEICTYKYVTERRPKPLFQWLLNPSNPEDARNLIGDVICFFLLTVLAVIAAYLCLMGASHYLSYKTQWEATGLVVLGLLISSIYLVWLVVTCRYHWRVWHDWRHTHQEVHLLEMKRRSLSLIELNNNNNNNNNGTAAAGATPACAMPACATPAFCPVCQGGSYSCTHCCPCAHLSSVQPDQPTAGDDDVFYDGGGGGPSQPADRAK